MKTFLPLGCGALLALSGMIGSLHAANPVIVHEWGTFTSLQDQQGHAIGGINVDDEPVPGFVWQYANRMVAAQYASDTKFGPENFGLPPYAADDGKGWTMGDPTVTMRLETPVLYLYPPKGQSAQSVPPLDVHVDFHGGVLSQYYPYAQTNGAVLNGGIPYLQKTGVTDGMTTGLTWKSVRMGATGNLIATKDKHLENAPWLRGQPVETDDKVWTTPREVSAPLLEVKFALPDYAHPGNTYACTQAEHFLFYRGVGHLDSPLGIRNVDYRTGEMSIGAIADPDLSSRFDGWLVEVQPNGSCAFHFVHERAGMISMGMPFYPHIFRSFSEKDFGTDNLTQLKASMQAALVKEGLYPDEASAMLRTWELSYFKSPGLRFFYIVPRAWVDKVLPLKITGAPTEITRVMVGRIELITDAQRAALARLAAGPCPDLAAVKKAAQDALRKSTLPKDEIDAFYRGEKPLSELGIPIPPLVQDYLSLGRFRDALIVHEQQLHPSPALAQFIKDNGLATQGN